MSGLTFPDLSAAISAGLRDAAETILAEAKSLTPVLTGELRDSGTLQVDGNEAAVGFTDSKAVGAHEDLNDRHPRGGQAKFLEVAAQNNQDAVAAALARHIGGVL